MKTKLLFSAIQKFKKGIKLKGIFTFLIILFMTDSSFSQVNVMVFEFNCPFPIPFTQVTVKFEEPITSETDPMTLETDYIYPGGKAFDLNGTFIEANWEVRYNSISKRWELGGPTIPGGVPIPFFFNTTNTPFSSVNTGNWISTGVGAGAFPCTITSIIYTPSTDDPDGDGDGFPVSVDCGDDEATVFPGAPEICDGLDNDCDVDGAVDEDIVDCNPVVILDYCNEAKTKILVCHNGKDICVSINAMPAHEAHEDYIGSCANARLSEGIVETPTSYDVVSWPNPTNDLFNVRMITPNYEDKVNLQAFDINGRLVHSKIINGNEDYQFGTNLQSGIYFVKISQASTTEVIKVIKR